MRTCDAVWRVRPSRQKYDITRREVGNSKLLSLNPPLESSWTQDPCWTLAMEPIYAHSKVQLLLRHPIRHQTTRQNVPTESARALPLQGATLEAQAEPAFDCSRHATSYGRTPRPAIASAMLWSGERSRLPQLSQPSPITCFMSNASPSRTCRISSLHAALRLATACS